MTNFCAVDGDKFAFVIQESYTHLHIVIRYANALYDKGSMFIYGNMNGSPFCGMINYNFKSGDSSVYTFNGDGCSKAYGGLESNGQILRIVLNVRTYSVYSIQCTDKFEIARTTG